MHWYIIYWQCERGNWCKTEAENSSIQKWGDSFVFFWAHEDLDAWSWTAIPSNQTTQKITAVEVGGGSVLLDIHARVRSSPIFSGILHATAAPVSVSTDWICLIKSELTVWRGRVQTWRQRSWIDLAHQVNDTSPLKPDRRQVCWLVRLHSESQAATHYIYRLHCPSRSGQWHWLGFCTLRLWVSNMSMSLFWNAK